MRIRISRLDDSVAVPGHGRRAGFWMQGCEIGCRGCHTHHSRYAGPATETGLSDVLADLPPGLDGVTITGGEPFDQPAALLALLTALRAAADGRAMDVVVCSGRGLAALREEFAPHLTLIDAIRPGTPGGSGTPGGPAALGWTGALGGGLLASAARWRDPAGSAAGQELIPLTALGRERYPATPSCPAEETSHPAGPARIPFTGGTARPTARAAGIPAARGVLSAAR